MKKFPKGFLVYYVVVVLSITIYAGCTLFKKTSDCNEIEELTGQVLKHKQGVNIEVKPIPAEKK